MTKRNQTSLRIDWRRLYTIGPTWRRNLALDTIRPKLWRRGVYILSYSASEPAEYLEYSLRDYMRGIK